MPRSSYLQLPARREGNVDPGESAAAVPSRAEAPLMDPKLSQCA